MPQMAPMNWLFLYFMFSFIFILFNFLNYYLYLIQNKILSVKNNLNKKSMNWKW